MIIELPTVGAEIHTQNLTSGCKLSTICSLANAATVNYHLSDGQKNATTGILGVNALKR